MGILSGFFKGGKNDNEAQMQVDQALKIIRKYGKLLEKSANKTLRVFDESKLPCPKEQIKKAIITALHSENDQQTKEILRAGYMELSSWQKGVGKKEVLYGLDVTGINLNDTPEKIINEVLNNNSGRDESWGPIVLKEMEELKQELDRMEL